MTVNGANNETNRRLQRLEEGQAETNRRLDNLETGQEELRSGQKELRSGQEELRSGQEELREAVTRIERNVQAIRDDIGPLKAAHAANGARKAVYRICLALSLQPVGILSEDDLAKIIHAADTTGISANELDSFLGADAVIEALGQDGATHYVAVEASYTADERDTRRALRNAEFLARFTSTPSHAVVAAQRIDERIRPAIDAGDIYWRQLTDRDFQVD